jgi:ribosomal protein L7/L12
VDSSVLLVVLVLVVGVLAVWVARLSSQVRALQRRVDQLVPGPSAHDRGSSPTVPPPTPLQATSAERVGLSAEGELLVRQALHDGDRIEAVKFIREETGMGLRDAHQYVKTLERRQ